MNAHPERYIRQAMWREVLNAQEERPFAGTTWFYQYWTQLDLYDINPSFTLTSQEANRQAAAIVTATQRQQHQELMDAMHGGKMEMTHSLSSYRITMTRYRHKKPLPYLYFPQKLATAIARLRSHTHRLAIATRFDLDTQHRLCDLCLVRDDERHCLTECLKFDRQRRTLMTRLGFSPQPDTLLQLCYDPKGPTGVLMANFVWQVWQELWRREGHPPTLHGPSWEENMEDSLYMWHGV
ncbi:hypothetical protein BJ508DRAFT_324009 [Ascobolus immersus RN42]|uniref:Uncharacterized protein n=1 Tax=Ascobolus immersus RN42 TaxID=1160509 RepID=A0A3N4IIM3_ASCIM|nr:hypothetical protein BJ508DRAFT_324009 [Ascobolus immersus RN42]